MTGKQNDCGRLCQVLGEFIRISSLTDLQYFKALDDSLILGNDLDSIGKFAVVAGMHDVQLARREIRHGQSLLEYGWSRHGN
jgi:hypothetical protein